LINRAFDRYADWRGSCSLVYDYTEVAEAVSFVDHIQEPYELYGYSAGAVTIGQILPRVLRLPEYVITVGALSSVNVDFSRYGIRFDNYFDAIQVDSNAVLDDTYPVSRMIAYRPMLTVFTNRG
jgi:hypothetical protein